MDEKLRDQRQSLFDLQDQLKGFDNLFHSVWRHGSNQLRLFCLWIVKSFRIQGADLETEKYCIFGKARFTRWHSYVCGIVSWHVPGICPYYN